ERLDDLRGRALRAGKEERRIALDALGARLAELETLVGAARGGDLDAGQQAERGLQEVQEQLDESEDDLPWPELEAEAMHALSVARAYVIEANGETENRHFQQLESELAAALRAKKPQRVEETTVQLRQLVGSLHFRQDDAWQDELELLASDLGRFSDLPRAR